MTRLAVLLLLAFSTFAWGAEPPPVLPAGFTIPAAFHEDPTRRKYVAFDMGQFDFVPAGEHNSTHQKVEGHLWRVAGALSASPKIDGDAVVALLATAFEADGWTMLRRQGSLVARKPQPAGELWLLGTGNAGYFSLVLMQDAAPSRGVVAAPPAARPERIADTQDFPYAPPFPGATLQKTTHDPKPFEIVLPGGGASSYATPFASKWYAEPHDVASYEFVAVYRHALEGAGWDVVRGSVAGDAVVIAHYAKNGRDLWLYTRADGSQQYIAVADFGAEAESSGLRKQIATVGHVALYGIYFDTDIATPRPESETTLQQVLHLLTDDKALRLEIQGHTDNTGTPQHNEALSAARAASVQAWLTAHGIAADRLTSKGYAATKPVADNGSP